MEKDKVQHLLISLYGMELCNALIYWQKSPHISFIQNWHKCLENSEITHVFDKDTKEEIGKKDRSASRQVLQEYLGRVMNYIVVQAFVYAYDNIKNSLKEIIGRDKLELDFMKSLFVKGDYGDEKLINIMRNAIAHNDDEVEAPRFKYDEVNDRYIFSFRDNVDAISLSTTQLIHLIKLYTRNAEKARSDKYAVAIQKNKIMSGETRPSSSLIKLFNKENGKIINPDEHQIKALDEVVDRINIGAFVPTSNYTYFYPHKDSSMNNTSKLLQVYLMLSVLYENRGLDSRSFGDLIFEKFGSSFNDMNSIYDVVAPLISNILFQICSNNPNSFLQRCVEDINPDINMREVRNSVMHGTFFYDRLNSLVFYDSKEKDEEDLKYVATLTFDQIREFFINANKMKFDNDNNLYNMGSDDIPYPHIVDLENELMKD